METFGYLIFSVVTSVSFFVSDARIVTTECQNGRIITLSVQDTDSDIFYLTSPDFGFFDRLFNRPRGCGVVLKAEDDDQYVKAEIIDIKLSTCRNSLNFYDGPSINSRRLGKVCSAKNTYVSSKKYMYIDFDVDNQRSEEIPYFKIKYSVEYPFDSTEGAHSFATALGIVFGFCIVFIIIGCIIFYNIKKIKTGCCCCCSGETTTTNTGAVTLSTVSLNNSRSNATSTHVISSNDYDPPPYVYKNPLDDIPDDAPPSYEEVISGAHPIIGAADEPSNSSIPVQSSSNNNAVGPSASEQTVVTSSDSHATPSISTEAPLGVSSNT